MDDQPSIYWNLKEVMAFLRRGRAQIDRYRKLPDFPTPIVPSGTERGSVLFLRHEIVDWANSRPRR